MHSVSEPHRTFEHRQSAHCESGVVSSLVTDAGLPLSEPMAFGLASALAFAYIPLIKLSGMPLIAYRMPPRSIIKGVNKRLDLDFSFATFRDPDRGMQALDAQLQLGQRVGLQTSVYWLPYFPDAMRFHFNAHNLVVYGKEGDDYLISDPVFETPVRCPAADLKRARFAKGALAAKGMMYRLCSAPTEPDWQQLAHKAIRANYRTMNGAPLPVIGIRGIRYLGRNIVKLAADQSKRDNYLPHYLAHIVRMQEEIGTGGAGFRFIYASFLEEMARTLDSDTLLEASSLMTDAGDEWRMFALHASKMFKRRVPMDANELAAALERCADAESRVWGLLKTFDGTN